MTSKKIHLYIALFLLIISPFAFAQGPPPPPPPPGLPIDGGLLALIIGAVGYGIYKNEK